MHSKRILAWVVLMAAALPAVAQDAPPLGEWQNEFELGVNLLQSSYSRNWNGGDKGSVAWAGSFSGRMENQLNEGKNWRNILKLAYGQTHQQDRDADGSLYWQKPDKTDDIIDFESLLRWTKASGWDPFVALAFISKFEDISDTEGRSIMFNPMILSPSAGISRKFITQEHRTLLGRLGVAYLTSSRSFFTNPAPSTDTQRESAQELAAEAVLEYKVGALDKRVDWESRLTLRLPFVYSGKSVFEDDFEPTDYGLPEDVASYTTNLDVDWQNTFTAAITKVIAVNLFIRWVYDKYDNTVKPVVEEGVLVNTSQVSEAIRKGGQFKQTLALGLSYKF